jgi:hypothetical protein
VVDYTNWQIHKECFVRRTALSLELLRCALPLVDSIFRLLSVQRAVDRDHVHPLSSLRMQ